MPTLAEIYLAKGRAESDRELRRAAIEANRSQQNTAIWGNALSNIGGAAASALTAWGEQKQRQPLIDLEVTERQQRVDANAAGMADAKVKAERDALYTRIMGESLEPGPDGLPRMNAERFAAGLQQNGLMDRWKDAAALINDTNSLLDKRNEAQTEIAGRIAAVVHNSGNTPEAFENQVKWATVQGLLSERYGAQLLKLAKEQPDKIPEITQGLIAQSKGAQAFVHQTEKPVVVGAGSALVDPSTGQPMYQAPAATPPPAPFTLGPGQQRFGPDGKPIASVAPTPQQGSNSVVAVIDPKTGKPVYVRSDQAAGMTPASNREQGRPVTSVDAEKMADYDTSIDDLAVLTETVKGNNATGTLASIGAALPNAVTNLLGWTEPKQKQATIDRVKQVIGKALEGGVLRKEDEYKYEKILPTIADDQSVVATKLEGLDRAIRLRRQTKIESMQDAGYDVSAFNARTAQRQPATVPPQVLAAGPGTHTFANGQVWEVSADGKSAKKIK